MACENNNVCPAYGRCGDVEESVLLSSVNARLRVVEKQSNAIEARVTQLEKVESSESIDEAVGKVTALIEKEASARLESQGEPSGRIESEASGRKADVDSLSASIRSESASRTNGDAGISARLDAEVSAREDLGVRVDEAIAERKEADTNLNTAIQSLATIVDSDRETLSDEIGDVRADSATLVDREKAERVAKDEEILARIAEIESRIDALSGKSGSETK